jgi:hypothetical protein
MIDIVLFIDFQAGFQPIAFNVAVNSYGVSQTGGFNTHVGRSTLAFLRRC